jgi:ribose 5-phosphate isomerase A
MTIYERALELVPNQTVIGLGSGRAAWAFIQLLGERIRSGRLSVRGVPTSDETARIATGAGVPLADLKEAGELAVTVDGADEVDPNLDLIKGYGRALVREKIVAASSRRLVVLVGAEKLVPQLGARGRLPVEVVPFAVPLCERWLSGLGLRPALWEENGRPGATDNGNRILDCATGPITDPAQLGADIRAIPGVIGTGLFLGMADTILVGEGTDFRLIDERRAQTTGAVMRRLP